MGLIIDMTVNSTMNNRELKALYWLACMEIRTRSFKRSSVNEWFWSRKTFQQM